MKRFFLFAGIIGALSAQAQQLSVSSNQLDFSDVEYSDKDSLQLDITNDFAQDVQVKGIKFFEKYGNLIYSASEDQFTIPSGQSKSVWIYFEPEHNIVYNSELVIETEYRGSIAIDLLGEGKFDTYYSSTFDKSEEDLKSALKTLLGQGYVSLGYSNGRNKMFMEFDNQKVNGQGASVNTIEGVYTGQLVTNYNSRTDAQNQGFNTEHTFPQGFFNSNEPMRSDLHHLYPTNSTANSQRGNLPFGVVTGSSSWSVGGSKKGGGVFEPRDVQKGATARAMMYFVLRYQDYSSFLSQQESILRQWHNDYQPTQIDINRNEAIALLQKNRNPLIDYPQLIERIQKIAGNSVAPDEWGLYVSNASLDLTQGSNIDDKAFVVITNYGNQDIEVESIALSGNIEFSAAQSDFVLESGESHVFEMQLIVGNGGMGELTFETNVTGQEDVVIPLTLPQVEPDNVNEITIEGLKAYPNPTQNYLNIELAGLANVEVLDAKGVVVYSNRVNSKLVMDVSNWAKGIYYVSVRQNNVLNTLTINID